MSAATGRLILPLAGTIIGFAIGGPFGAAVGSAIGAGLGYLLFPPEGKTIEGPRLDDLKVSFSSYGRPIPRLYGTFETGGNVVWSPGLVEHRIEEEQGGKGAPSVTTVTFLYTASFRINYCVGVADAILRNWADGKLITDITGTTPITNFIFGGAFEPLGEEASSILFGEFDFSGPGDQALRNYLGTTTQLPGPAEQADKGIANTSAYRGTVGQEWEDLPLENYGNRIPQITAEIAMEATESFPVDTLAGAAGRSFWEWQVKGQTFLTSGFIRVDNVGQTVLTSSEISNEPDFPCTDSSGNFYRVLDGFGLGDPECRKYDGSTLALVETSTPLGDPFSDPPCQQLSGSLNWSKGRIFGGIVLADGTEVGELLFVARDTLSSTNEVIVIDINALQSSCGGVINRYFASAMGSSLVVDSERHLWAFANVSGDTILTRVAPGSGDIVETHTISGDTTDHMAYEPATNSLILGNSGSHLIRWGIDSQSIEARLDGITFSGGTKNISVFWNGPSAAGILYLQTGAVGGTFTEFDVINMVRGRSWSPSSDFGLSTTLIHRGIYDPLHHAMIKRSDGAEGNIHWLYLNRMSGDDITVRSIVEDVSSLVDLVAGTDIDATELTDTLPGYIVRSRMTARKALEPLATAFNFRSVESDFKIKFPKRGGASVGNIPQIDLGATAGETPTTQAIQKTRIPEDQLFETAIIEYIDPTFDNNPNTQQAKRSKEAIDVGGSLKFDFPGALGNDQAAQIIERILFQAWSGRTSVATNLPLKHILKDPGDVVTLTKDGKTVTLELHDVQLGANSIIKISGTIDDAIVHVSTAEGADALGVEDQVIVVTGPTEFFILDTPLLRDVDNGEGIYVAAGTPGNASWPGAAIYRGLTAGETGPFIAITSSRDMDYGFTEEALPDASPNIFDRDNALTLTLFSGVLSSSTETAVLNGANALLIGDEIVQFVNATLNADGTYTIDTLLRGRRGTEFATGTHIAGDNVVVLSANTLLRVAVNLSDHLSTFFYRAITLGDSQFSSKTIEQLLRLRSQMPYAPSHVAGSISANDWTFTTVRRTRIGGSWKDSIDVPLGELTESFEWDVMDGATVKRTLTSSTASVTYTSAQQNVDFGDNVTTVELNVYQISADVDRGFARNATLVGG